MRIWTFIGLCIFKLFLDGFTPHIEELQHVPCPMQKYRLVDLGETTVSINRLSRLHKGFSYAPCINNHSLVAWNGSEGGVLKSLKEPVWEFIPRFEGMRIYIAGLNDNGDLLIAIERGFESTEWLLWPCEQNTFNQREHIHTVDPFSPDLLLSAFNKERQVVGYFKKNGATEPAMWSQQKGLAPLGKASGLEAHGFAKAINDHNTVAGLFEEMKVHSPFVWNNETGFEVMRNYRDKLFPVGWMEFSDILITSDDVIYGNYWLKHTPQEDVAGKNCHYGFVWRPLNSTIDQLELEGMRLTAVNIHHTLVGSWQGKAALREQNRRPLFVESMMSLDDVQDWELLEATGINDRGQIVGYGTYKGKTHIFLAEPL